MDLRVLVIDDEPGFLQMLQVILSRAGYQVAAATSAEDAMHLLRHQRFDLCLCDLKMPGVDGMGFLDTLRTEAIPITVIVMSAYGSNDAAIAAMKAGAYDYINKPFQADEILLTLRKAEEREQLRRENLELKSRVGRVPCGTGVIAKSQQMRKIIATATRIAAYRSTVLLTGESGTGKEVLARLIHDQSPRARMPFVAVNCGAIPAGLMESEFFGHVKGAFTDAAGNKRGLIESANGGTLFLDEVGDLPRDLQPKLLRALETGTIDPLGGASRPVDVRIVAATHHDLAAEAAQDRFRADLYFRLAVVEVRVPALRERPEDVPLLVEHFLAKWGGGRRFRVARDAMRLLRSAPWPGNVRELENACRRFCLLSETGDVTPERVRDAVGRGASTQAAEAFPLPPDGLPLRELEADVIRRALRLHDGNRSRTARYLEIPRHVLLYRMRKYGIDARGGDDGPEGGDA